MQGAAKNEDRDGDGDIFFLHVTNATSLKQTDEMSYST